MNSQLKRLELATERFSTARSQEFDRLAEELTSVNKLLTQAQAPQSDLSRFLMHQAKSLQQIRYALTELHNLSQRVPLENRILEHIWFEGMDAREEAIRDAEEGTFEWLLQGRSASGDDNEYWDRDQLQREQLNLRPAVSELFMGWLTREDGVFHLSGKPGSGKSTAMKLIYGHGITKRSLTSWASGRILVSAHFYFWNSGSSMQMSLEGLYRSILFEVLKACPELISELFPEQWARMKAEATGGASDDGQGIAFAATLFRPAKITQAFHALLDDRRLNKYRFCFFIDGLDEFQGDSVDHWELAESILKWCQGDNVKCCVSSRPYTEFIATFREERRLYLHDLNKLDIYTFSRHMFENDRNFKRIAHSYDRLVRRIVDMSEGVFLWARLVVRALITSIGRFDSEATLYKKLEVLPTDLETLYDRLLEGLDPLDRRLSDLMLLITLHNSKLTESEFPLSVLALSYLGDLEDKSFPSPSYPSVCTEDELKERFEQVKRQVSGLTKGLLEVGEVQLAERRFGYDSGGHNSGSHNAWSWIQNHRVRFFHRTVPDYLESSEKLRQEKLNWETSFARLRLAELASLDKDADIFKTHPILQVRLHQQSEHVLQHYIMHDLSPRSPKSFHLIETQKHALGHLSPPLSWYWVFDHRRPGYGPWFEDQDTSFNHFIAYHGYGFYILDQLGKGKHLGDTNNVNILLSAACGLRPQVSLVTELLDRGYSSSTQVSTYNGLPDEDLAVVGSASIWILFVSQFVDYVVKLLVRRSWSNDIAHQTQLSERAVILVELLARRGVDTNVLIQAFAQDDSCVYNTTLEDFLRVTLSFLRQGTLTGRALGGRDKDWPAFYQWFLRGVFPADNLAQDEGETKGRYAIHALTTAHKILVLSEKERVTIRSLLFKFPVCSFRFY